MNWTRKEVTHVLQENGIQLKRSLGQNYLVDGNFLEALARDAEAGPGDTVVEIGSGLGPLAGKIWRVGLMGASSAPRLIVLLLGALETALAQQGRQIHA